MPPEKDRRPRRHNQHIYKRHPQFDVTPYVDNPHMIKSLHESRVEAFAEARYLDAKLIDAENQIETLVYCNHDLELQNQRLKIRLTTANHKLEESSKKWKTFPQYFVTVVGTALLSFGISTVTTSSSNLAGWVMVVSGGVLELVAFFITLSSKPERTTDE